MPSSVVAAFRYDPLSGLLIVTYVSGNVYGYFDVPEEVYLAMKDAPSKGVYLNKEIKGKYRYKKMKIASNTILRILLFIFFLNPCFQARAQIKVLADKNRIELSNDKITLGMTAQGGTLKTITLNNDPEKLSPLSSIYGHFICVDGFGPVSKEEEAAGLPIHGEASRLAWTLSSSTKKDHTLSALFSVHLPLVQEDLSRSIYIVDGENVIYIKTEVESLLSFDRPISWGEHLTLGSPFLKPGKIKISMSAKKAMTRPYDALNEGVLKHRLQSSALFNWPVAPGLDGHSVDLSGVPEQISPTVDRTTTLMDTSRNFEFVAALNTEKRFLLGYIFRRQDNPWLQSWENYQPDGTLSRGLEFAVQPFDLPRREIVSQNKLFDTPTYRWLPARSKINSSFLIFWIRVPEGMNQVDQITLKDGLISVEDFSSNKKVVLKASRGLVN